jgi:hypothetical protein
MQHNEHNINNITPPYIIVRNRTNTSKTLEFNQNIEEGRRWKI